MSIEARGTHNMMGGGLNSNEISIIQVFCNHHGSWRIVGDFIKPSDLRVVH